MRPIVNAYLALGPLRPFLLFALVALLITTSSRVGLMLWQWDRVDHAHGAWSILVGGLRMDMVAIAYLILIPAVFSPFFCSQKLPCRIWRTGVSIWLALGLVFLFLMEVSTPGFILEYDRRPNRLFIEYLESPKEVIEMLWGGFRVSFVAGTVAIVVGSYFAWRLFAPLKEMSYCWKPSKKVMATVLSLLILFVCARSSFQHRPANPSTVSFSNDTLVNMLPLSSGYNVLYSLYRMKNEKNAAKLYGHMPEEKMIEIVTGGRSQSVTEISTLRDQNPTYTRSEPLNLVIIVEESLGATYVESLGGLPVTPELEKLKTHGWWFENFYATGTRSVRGLEAITTGFLPSPARAVLKLPKAQSGFFTLAGLLGEQGYDTSFIYGGESHFDNMKGFFLNNGFQRVVDRPHFKSPEFVGSWGVSDEDLFVKAHEEFSKPNDKPFFSLVFSSSNHTPFEFPDGKIELFQQPKAHVNNAVKYADYSVGRFFEMARDSNYWDNTLFVVIADHDSRVFGADLVPIEKFKIPALILGPGVPIKSDSTLASQIDLAPTLLSLMGIEAEHPMVGQDLTKIPDDYVGRAIMQYDDNQAYMEGESVAILQPGKPISYYQYKDKMLTWSELQPQLGEKALAHALWTSWAYANGQYRLPRNSEHRGSR